MFNGFWIESRQNGRLEVDYFSRVVRDVVAKCVANCLTAGALMHNVTDRAMNLFHGIGTAKNQ